MSSDADLLMGPLGFVVEIDLSCFSRVSNYDGLGLRITSYRKCIGLPLLYRWGRQWECGGFGCNNATLKQRRPSLGEQYSNPIVSISHSET
jgi:hypothetical protein